MTPTDIDPRILTAIANCLGTLIVDPAGSSIEEHILASLDEGDDDKVDLTVLGDLENAIAYTTDPDVTWLLIPQGDWTWNRRARSEELLAISDHGDLLRCTVFEFRADQRFWVRQGARFAADSLPSLQSLPVVFDGLDWAGTHVDSGYGESEWILTFNGEEDSFDLPACRLGFDSSARKAAGRWLEIETDGYSMSTGQIGVTIAVDVDGGLFVSTWGYITTFWGLATDTDLTPEQLLAYADPESRGFTSVCRITSDHLTKEQMRLIVPTILSNTDDDEVEITCADWSGSLSDWER